MIEHQLGMLYASVLAIPIEQINLEESFFDLGGDSILVIQLVGKIKTNMKVTVTIKDLLEHQSVKQLAILIERKGESVAIDFEPYTAFSLSHLSKESAVDA